MDDLRLNRLPAARRCFSQLRNNISGKRFVLNDKNELIRLLIRLISVRAKSRKARIAAFFDTRLPPRLCANRFIVGKLRANAKARRRTMEKAWAVFFLSRTARGGNFAGSFRINTKPIVTRRYERILQTKINSLPDKLAALHYAYILCRAPLRYCKNTIIARRYFTLTRRM